MSNQGVRLLTVAIVVSLIVILLWYLWPIIELMIETINKSVTPSLIIERMIILWKTQSI